MHPAVMSMKSLSLALILALPAAAGPVVSEPDVEPAEPAREFVPAFDAMVAGYEVQDTFDFDSSTAELDASRFSLVSFLSKPLPIGGNWRFLPALDYGVTMLDFGNTPAGFPVGDEDLHKLGLHAVFYHHSPGSRWIYGGWGRANFASDCQDIGSDDFYYDVAVGAGYRITDRFLLGLGVAGLELGGDESILAGPGFYWKPSDTVDVSLIGILFNATWRPTEDWATALRFRPFGNSWNIDNAGVSQQIDLTSYTLRLHLERRLYRDLWVSVGAGYAFADDFEVRNRSGRTIFSDDLDGGFSAAVGLRIRTW